jgi:RND family efflux transporter MFP subunit
MSAAPAGTKRVPARPLATNRAASLALAALLLAPIASTGEAADLDPSDTRPRGVVRSVAEATITSEIAARVMALPFREGQAFRAGDVLVSFDCTRLKAEVDGVRADLTAARIAHDGSKEMERFKAIGARDVAMATARLEKATAELAVGQARLAACEIKAPFDGVVTERAGNEHEIASPSQPLLRVVDDRRLEIELIAPSRWMSWLRPGQAFRFAIDETGRDHAAVVHRIAAVVDPVSQTVKLFGRFGEQEPAVRHGMSGSARFEAGSR